MCMEVRGQLVGVRFLLSSCRSQGSNSGHHVRLCGKCLYPLSHLTSPLNRLEALPFFQKQPPLFKGKFHVAQAGLKFIMELRMTLDSCFSCSLLPLECWYYRQASPCCASKSFHDSKLGAPGILLKEHWDKDLCYQSICVTEITLLLQEDFNTCPIITGLP